MMDWIHDVSAGWLRYFLLMNMQTTLFVGLVLVLLHVWRRADARLLRGLALIGLVKVLLPPLIPQPGIIPAFIIDESVAEVVASAGPAAGSSIAWPVVLMLGWLGVSPSG